MESTHQPRPHQPQLIDLAIISNEPTPYRLHVLRRVARELPGVRLHSLFTHAVDPPSSPWRMEMAAEIRPVSFPKHHLSYRPDGSTGWPAPLRSAGLYREIRDYLVANHVSMAILLGYNDLVRVALIRWARRAGLPLLLAGDSNVFSEGRVRGTRRWIKRRFVGWVVRSVAGLMPMGTCGRAYFRLYCDHDKPSFLFPYEPDYDALMKRDEPAERDFRRRFGLAQGRRRLVYCGRLVGVKRVDILIDAFVKNAGVRPGWDLVIVGDGPLRAELAARVPEELKDRVRFLGFVQMEDVARCYHSCDVLVLPSEYEPWALVVNEAVACGLAVVATEMAGSAVELVRHGANGLIVPPRSVPALAEALRSVTQADLCARMREDAPVILAQWLAAADPVAGVRQALEYFGLL